MRVECCRWRVLIALFVLAASPLRGDETATAFFDRAVAPLLARRCLECHNSSDKKGGLDLTTRQSVLNGGESGPALVAGNVEQSLLWQRIADEEMPPKHPLSAAEKEALRQWIAAGAVWGADPLDPFRHTTETRAGYDWWSLQPVQHPAVPATHNDHWPRNPMDRFILARLEEAGLSPAPEADRRTLIRRLSFDLLGLPPTPDEVAAFIADESPDAYEQLVERSLASPAYGERWARHWLDVVRFGESQGFERDKLRTNAWPYRDWLVDALNRDLPYDEFVRRQLIGDLLADQQPSALAATGYLVAGPYDEVGQQQQSQAMRRVVRQDELEDLVGSIGQTFLALTVNCARCHDHKFDPISQKEYYQLTAALGGVRHGERTFSTESASRFDSLAAIQACMDALTRCLEQLERPVREEARAQLHDRELPAEKVAASAEVLSNKISEAELLSHLSPQQREQRSRWVFEIDQLRRQRERMQNTRLYAVVPQQPEPAHVLIRGNPGQPGEPVSPKGIAALSGLSADFHLAADVPEAEARRKLAEWITDPRNPLFARVIVNRVWQSHFGTGIVETPNDFGFNGGRPSHPELLDWLAAELIRRNWSLKSLHRLLVTSATYRQSSAMNSAAARIDAANRLLWRKSPVRLDAEGLRDSLLSVVGCLDRTIGGPGYEDHTTFVSNSQFYVPVDPVGIAFNRRTLYRTWIRSGRNRFLDVFDCPDPSTMTPRRAVTTTPLQALALMNNAFALRMSAAFAERLRREAGPMMEERIALAYRLAYGRPPESDETALGAEFVARYGLSAYCRVLLNSNEFLTID